MSAKTLKVKKFEDLITWQKAKALSVAIYRITNTGGFAKDYGLKDQIRRAGVSVMSNIAEGFERYSRSEFRQFLSIARGSVAEVRSQLYLARELKYIDAETFQSLYDLSYEISQHIGSLRKSLGKP